MTIAESLLPEYDHEMANTRRVLERVPDDKLNWKAHEKSNTIGWVSSHLADIPSWLVFSLNQDSLDIEPLGGKPYRTQVATTPQEILDTFDKNVAEGRKALAGAADATFAEPWTLLRGGNKIFTIPKSAVVRSFVLSHIIHHRAILTVYLRLVGAPVPGLYGPSADEQF